MLIPFGVFSAAGAGGGGGGAGAYELIETAYGTGSSSVITFSSIPSTYKHLQIRMTHKNTGNSYTTQYLRFNSDSGNNYSRHQMVGDGSSVTSGSTTSTNYIQISSSTSGTSIYPGAVIDILDFGSSNKNTTVKSFSGYNDGSYARMWFFSGAWLNTAAVTSVSIHDAGSSFDTASRFSLYGVKG